MALKALIPLAVVFAVLLFIALIRVGVKVRYSEDGFLVKIKAFLFYITVFPREKKDKPKKEKVKKDKKTKEEKAENKKRGGSVSLIKKVFAAAKKVLGRLKRKLSIDVLTVHYISGCDDPCDAALNFGMASAGAGMIIPFLKKNFKLKRCHVTTDVDFSGEGDKVFLEMQLSLALWEVIYIASGLLVLLKKDAGTKKTETANEKDRAAERKVDNNGKTTLK